MPELYVILFVAFCVCVSVSLGFRIAEKQVGEDTERGRRYCRISALLLILSLVCLAVSVSQAYAALKHFLNGLSA